MKRFIKMVKAIVMKSVALFLWPSLSVFNLIYKVITPVYRFVFYPIIVFGLLVTAVLFFSDGFSTGLLKSLMTFVSMGAMYFLLPMFAPVFMRAQMRVKYRALSPVVVRSPVKFTL